jgi:hypothetical protein
MPESHSETVALAVRAATEWIEAATGRRFPPDRTFRATLEDGVLLCELMDNLSPGLLRHTPHLNNVERFLMGCKDLGMSKEQLFEETDLRDPSLQDQSRDKRKSLNERLKSVCLTLFWLSQIADYSGPQLELTPFTALFPDHQVMPREVLTSEEEQTADQLLADIQSAVDEMLNDFQTNNLSPESTPPSSQPPLPTSSTASIDKSSYHHYQVDSDRESVVIEMGITGGGFGFQVRGGLDTMMNPQVDIVLPGSAAEKGGVKSGDELISVNDRDVTGLRHADLVATIRQVWNLDNDYVNVLMWDDSGSMKTIMTSLTTPPCRLGVKATYLLASSEWWKVCFSLSHTPYQHFLATDKNAINFSN